MEEELAIIADGGVQIVPGLTSIQYVYLDLDGAETVYRGELLTVGGVTVEDPRLTETRIAGIVSALNVRYAAQGVVFSADRAAIPEGTEYSTVYVGKTRDFASYGAFAGLAETVDYGNANRSDNAFVLLDALAPDSQIVETISHETDHLLGTLDHGGTGLDRYAEKLVVEDATSSGLTIASGDTCTVLNDGTVIDATVNSGGKMYVSSGGVLNGATVNSGALYIKDGTANDVVLNSGGVLNFMHGLGTLSHLEVHGGKVTIAAIDATIRNVTVDSKGSISLPGGQLSALTVSKGGTVYAYGGAVSSATVSSGGKFYVENYGSVNGIEVLDGGLVDMFLNDALSTDCGGEARNVTVSSGGSLYISSSCLLTGEMRFESGAVVSAYEGAAIDFDLSGRSVADAALLNDYTLLNGAPDFRLTVDSALKSGIYQLARNAAAFQSTITVYGETGEAAGTLAFGEILSNGDADYMLIKSDGNLQLKIVSGGDEAPTVRVAADIVANTCSSVTVTAVFADDAGVVSRQFRIGETGEWQNYMNGVTMTGNGTVFFMAADTAGNIGVAQYEVTNIRPDAPVVIPLEWPQTETGSYTLELSRDDFSTVLTLEIGTSDADMLNLPEGAYRWRVKAEEGSGVLKEDSFEVAGNSITKVVGAAADGKTDLLFAHPNETWEAGYWAQHAGSANDWSGTGEYALVYGKNRFFDFFEGSDDVSVLYLTDDENGDAIFVDDTYSELPECIEAQQSRLAKLQAVYGGAGGDVIDLTSQQFEYVGGGLVCCGGEGNDTIWANKGNNFLFGDAGNDRIVGASGDDVIAGGIGDDRMNGGGGDDLFAFCDEWGEDTVQQIESGSVTLWFASGSVENWNADTLVYADGENSVSVKGISADRITLKFGDDGSERYDALAEAGAFLDFVSDRVFRENEPGILAGL